MKVYLLILLSVVTARLFAEIIEGASIYAHPTFAAGNMDGAIPANGNVPRARKEESSSLYKKNSTFVAANSAGSALNKARTAMHNLSDDLPKYYIITSSTLESGFKKLATWKTKKGLPTEIVTIESIDSTCSGVDMQDRIRKFIRNRYNEGAEYILLGGDESIIPVRIVYQGGLDNPVPPQYDKSACDLYYSDLDGTWDSDGDNIFGELLSDSVDMCPDISVGRISVESLEECAAFVDKVLIYERNPGKGYLQNALFCAVDANNAENDADSLAADFPSGWNAERLYGSKENLTVSNFTEDLNGGLGFGFIISHGYENEIKFSATESFTADDLNMLTNTGKYPVVAAANCRIGAFDTFGEHTTDCIVEKLMYMKEAGTVAFLANSRMGSQAEGATQEYIGDFYRAVISESKPTLGKAFLYAMADNVASAKKTTEHCYAFYGLNLHGDPSMQIWTAEPEELDVEVHTDFRENIKLDVSVRDQAVPVDSALVTIMWAGESVIEKSSHTDQDGNISFEVEPKTDYDSLWITVTKKNCLPVEKSISRDVATKMVSKLTKNNSVDWHVAGAGRKIRVYYTAAEVAQVRTVEICIFDLGGRVVYKKEARLESGSHSIVLDKRAAWGRGVRVFRVKARNVIQNITVPGC